MKKLFVLSLLVVNLPAFGMFTDTLVGQCGPAGNKMKAVFDINTYNCNAGYYMPANYDGCQPCLNNHTCSGGTFTFNPTESQGIQRNEYITQTMNNSCENQYHKMVGVFEINQYTCSSGQFLPANTLGCVSCPTGYTCAGGTFTFNPSESQGLVWNNNSRTQSESKTCATNFPRKLNASFTANEHTCSAGYYMPANYDGCQQCPADSYCVGGTYNFNETNAQGATACDAGAHSPTGSSSASQCVMGYTCTSGQYLPKNTTTCVACPNGYTCAGGTYSFNETTDQGIVGNTITVIWNGATAEDVAANNAGTVVYGGDIRTPVRPDPSQIPIGKRFVGWTFRKTN